jgi:hypothetical protein
MPSAKDLQSALLEHHPNWTVPERRVRKFLNRHLSNHADPSGADDDVTVASSVETKSSSGNRFIKFLSKRGSVRKLKTPSPTALPEAAPPKPEIAPTPSPQPTIETVAEEVPEVVPEAAPEEVPEEAPPMEPEVEVQCAETAYNSDDNDGKKNDCCGGGAACAMM